MDDRKVVSVMGTIIYNTGESTEVTNLEISSNGQWIQEPPKVIERGTPATFTASGVVVDGVNVKGSISLGSIVLEFELDGSQNSASYKQMMGPTITATITAGVKAEAKYDIER